MAATAVERRGVSVALACRAFGVSETCYRSSPLLSDENEQIADLLTGLTDARKTWGFGLCFVHLRNVKGYPWNHKRVPDYAPFSAVFGLVQIANKQQLKEGWAMARNKVQFQKGLSEPGFERLYGTEEQCRAAVVASRLPDGFVCPECGGKRHSVVTTRGLCQCSACRVQTSPIAGTIFAATRLKLRIWFRAIYHLTQTKQGISGIELARRLGVTQTTARKIKHKFGQVMLGRDGAASALTARAFAADVGADAARPAKLRLLPRSRPRRKASPSA